MENLKNKFYNDYHIIAYDNTKLLIVYELIVIIRNRICLKIEQANTEVFFNIKKELG